MCTIMYMIVELQNQNVNAATPFTTEGCGDLSQLAGYVHYHV